MRRHLPQPSDAGRLEANGGIEPARDGVLHDGLPLFLQQSDELLLAADVATNPPVGVIEVADDGGLLGGGREGNRIVLYESLRYPLLTCCTSHFVDTELPKFWKGGQAI